MDPLTIWPRITEILKRVDSVLLSNGCVRGIEGTLKRTRYLVATIVLARIFGTFYFNISNLLKLDLVLLSDSLILDTWKECIAFKYDKKQLRSNKNNQNQNQPNQDKMSRENAEQLLNAAVQQEQATKRKLQKAMSQPRRKAYDKNW